MKLGVDFGTNRIVVAAADRGNYPLVSFDAPDGTTADWFPSLIALRAGDKDNLRYGWDAWETQVDDSWIVVRSIKRFLEQVGPETSLDLGEQQVKIADLLNGLSRALLGAIQENSNLKLAPGEPLQVVLGVPAHANTNQRFLTVEAFRSAGFEVLGLLNEPSAASIEFGHRQRQSKVNQETILVYDLGGGTFDASLVTVDEKIHHVIASEGIPTLGGDDFDQILADLALDALGVSESAREKIPAGAWFRLVDECRIKKESLHPNSRRVGLDFEQINPAWGSVQVSVAAFYEAARPLVEETVSVAEDLLSKYKADQFEALYLTGGGSELPLIARVLRERFGRRVRRSAYTRSATAIGLAIQADQPETYRVHERFTRFFGVWREADSGSRIIFDPLFEKGTPLPSTGGRALKTRRVYRPVHNIGHFRFLECSHRAEDGAPTGDITLWDEIRFPFDPTLNAKSELSSVPVMHAQDLPPEQIAEVYECDAGGSIRVTIANESAGYSRTYPLGRWSLDTKSVKPGRGRKKVSAASS
ncbi:MAG: Hsp70 family protein [Acidobacteriaceae bacterium]|nr:Hsp70 family protein [Acidobacteriaceae bacterium]MBV9780699.1 Hsp70 family protein [Acidobacteriaceae bacterium]